MIYFKYSEFDITNHPQSFKRRKKKKSKNLHNQRNICDIMIDRFVPPQRSHFTHSIFPKKTYI